MKLFTTNPIQNIWRLMLAGLLLYIFIGLCEFVYMSFPLAPKAVLLTVPLMEPSYAAAYVNLIAALLLAILITVFPALFLWGFVEDKFWPRAAWSFPVTNKYPERTQR